MVAINGWRFEDGGLGLGDWRHEISANGEGVHIVCCLLLTTDKDNFDDMFQPCEAFVPGQTCWDRQVTNDVIEALYSNPHKLLQMEENFSHLHD